MNTYSASCDSFLPKGSAAQIDKHDPRDLQRRILLQEKRDYQLWSLIFVALLVLTGGFAALLFPSVIWRHETGQESYLPALLFGFVTLVILFNVYLFDQRRILRATKLALLDQLVRTDEAISQSFLDPLTRVFNRRYLEHLLPHEMKRADRAETELAVVMVDVDDFKTVNTRFGHLEGDHFLQQVAQVLQQTFRQSDVIVRYGGDEFLVILPDTDREKVQIAIGRLAREVALWNLKDASRRYGMRLSCGAACRRKGDSIEEVLGRADERMYRNKTEQRAAT